MAENRIILTLLNGTGYVFDVNDYMKLREKHHIVGSFVGTTNVRYSTSNEFRLPAELTIFETRLLINEGLAILVSKTASLTKNRLLNNELPTAKIAVTTRLEKQKDLLKAEKLRETKLNMEQILKGKRKKLRQAGKNQEANALTADSVLEEIEKSFVYNKCDALLEIPCIHLETHVANLVQLPSLTANESLKYRILYDFWKLGKYVTPGDAFGADFLIYPGDPMLYHATHIVIIIYGETPTIKALDLITKARLAVIVNKLCVFAYKTSENEKIQYQTLKWDGNIEKELQMKTTENVTVIDSEDGE